MIALLRLVSCLLSHSGLTGLSAITMLACVGVQDQPPALPPLTFSTRDSVGIQIVENRGDPWAAPTIWSVDSVPLLSLGTAGGSDSSQHFTRIVGATRLSDGRIVVASSGNSEMRFFDSTGTYLMSAGRRGRGPGEFSELGYMARFRGDSLVTYDRARNVVMVFDGQGRFVSTARVTASLEIAASPRGAFPDGHLLASWNIESRSQELARGPRLSTARLAMLSRDGTNAAEYGRRTVSRSAVTFARGSRYPDPPRIDTLYNALATISITTLGSHFIYADASQFEIMVYSSDGKLVRIIRAEALGDTIPASAKHDTASMMITSFGPEGQQRVRVRPNAVVWPDVYPAFTAVESDAEGNLWVRPYPKEVQTGPQAWLVFDSTGALRGKVQVPLVSNIVEIGGNHLIGRIMDSLGVETVRVYRIRKGGG